LEICSDFIGAHDSAVVFISRVKFALGVGIAGKDGEDNASQAGIPRILLVDIILEIKFGPTPFLTYQRLATNGVTSFT
jgi:hypothetical protein